MSESSPVYYDLTKVVSNTGRYTNIADRFKQLYGSEPDFFVRAPGRVNLIGEHVDYSGYPVMPMAIERDTIVAIKVEQDSNVLKLANLDDKYPQREYPKSNPEIDASKHEWSNYFLCGYRGVLEAFKRDSDLAGFSALVHGTVPIGSGLSSSAALVCASALATSLVNNIPATKLQLADICAKAEQYVGVQSGGMDQAISYLGQQLQASRIFFNPLRSEPMPLPEGASFIVAHSLVEANKYLSADTGYNMRVVECKLAAALLAKASNLSINDVKILVDIQTLTNSSLGGCIDLVKKHLHQEPYTRAELASLLGLSLDELVSKYIGEKIQSDKFLCYQRALHVFQESKLVEDFASVCTGTKLVGEEKARVLGDLMNQSHYSCRDNFECSCPELDTLTQAARNAGAFGSRLTGAGWGGCTVSLVPTSKVPEFIESLKQNYFAKHKPHALANIEEYLFATTPGAGAFVFRAPPAQ